MSLKCCVCLEGCDVLTMLRIEIILVSGIEIILVSDIEIILVSGIEIILVSRVETIHVTHTALQIKKKKKRVVANPISA